MYYVKILAFPKGTDEKFIKEIASKLGSWYIVTKCEVEGLNVCWNQTTYNGHGAEGISAFVEGLMLGFNLKSKQPVKHKIAHPGCDPYEY